MDKRALMVATVPSMVGCFNMDNIHILLEIGYKVDVACNFTDHSVWTEERMQRFRKELKRIGVGCIQLDFSRNPLMIHRHITSYAEMRRLITKRHYVLIHTHTPIASAIVRLAVCNRKIKVIYTAHGFHFYSGAPLKNWLIFYPIEKWLSRYTDVLITINREDYKRALKRFHAKKTVYVPGVGIETDKFSHVLVDVEKKKREIDIPEKAKVLVSVGELSTRKNHKIVVRSLNDLDLKDVYYIIVGKGRLKKELEELNTTGRVKLLGFREDIVELLHIADAFIFPSIQEGLPMALMEAMASGLPIACSRIRGNTDLIEDGKGGFLFNPSDINDVSNNIQKLLNSDKESFGNYNFKKIEKFNINRIRNVMRDLYCSI